MQGGYGAVFAVRVQSFLSYTSVAVQVLTEPVSCQGVMRMHWRADAGIRVHIAAVNFLPADFFLNKMRKKRKVFGLINYLWFLVGWPGRSPSKNRDKQMHFIVRVRDRAVKALGSRSQVKEQEF